MQQQPGIHTISQIAPPSYEEATKPNQAVKDNGLPHWQQTNDQYPQVSSYAPSTSGYQGHSFYPGGGVQPGSTAIYVSSVSEQPPPVVPVRCVVRENAVVYRNRSRGSECLRRFVSIIVVVFITIILVRTILLLARY